MRRYGRMRLLLALVLGLTLETASFAATVPPRRAPVAAPTPAQPNGDIARLVGTWGCVGTTPGSSSIETYSREGSGAVELANAIRTSTGAHGLVDEMFRFEPQTQTWTVTALANTFFDALRASGGMWSAGAQWILTGSETFRKQTMAVRIVYTDLGPSAFRREHQVQLSGNWRDDAAYICRRSAGVPVAVATVAVSPATMPRVSATTAPPRAAGVPYAARPQNVALSKPWPFAPWRFAPSGTASPTRTVTGGAVRLQRSAVSPASPAGRTDRAYALIGTWACRTLRGDPSTHVYTADGKDALALRNLVTVGGKTYDVEELYRFDSAHDQWQNVTSDGAYRATAPPWLGASWTFDGIENEGRPSDVHMTYTLLGPTAFRREFSREQNGTWVPYLSENCRRD